MATHILVVDDETAIADLVEVYLKNEGFTIHKFYNASDALACVRTTRLNLAVLDVMLPDMDGFTLCQRIREDHLFPIIMLTAKGEVNDRITGLEMGADDYIVKPFEMKELIARIKAVLRRSVPVEPERTIQLEGLSVSLENYAVQLDGRPLEMPPKEIELLYFSPPTRARCSRASSCSSRCGGSTFSAIRALWTCTSSASARSWATAIPGSSRPSGASATNSKSSKRKEGSCAAIFSGHCFRACSRRT